MRPHNLAARSANAEAPSPACASSLPDLSIHPLSRRLLNALPANRVTATAVDGMLRAAAFRMCEAYRGQFMKLLRYIDAYFLPALATSNDPDARAVFTRIQTFLKTGRFGQPPEGRNMPQTDASSYDRA